MVATINANERETRSQMKRDMRNQTNTKADGANNPRGNYNQKENNFQRRNNEFKPGNASRGNYMKTNDRSSNSFSKRFNKDEEIENRSAKGHRGKVISMD